MPEDEFDRHLDEELAAEVAPLPPSIRKAGGLSKWLKNNLPNYYADLHERWKKK